MAVFSALGILLALVAIRRHRAARAPRRTPRPRPQRTCTRCRPRRWRSRHRIRVIAITPTPMRKSHHDRRPRSRPTTTPPGWSAPCGDAAAAGLAGVLVAPGPGPGLADRLPADRDHRAAHPARPRRRTGDPTLVVPDAGAPGRRGGGRRARADPAWTGPTATTRTAWPRPLLTPDGPLRRLATTPGPCTCSVCSAPCPAPSYSALTDGLPMLRAVKDAAELERLAAAGAAADAAYERDPAGAASPAAGRPTSPPTSPRCCASFGHSQVDFTVVGSGPNGANPHHEAGDRVIEAGRHGRARLRRAQARLRLRHHPHRARRRARPPRSARCTTIVRAGPAGRRSRRCGPGVACQEIDRVARAVITDAGYGEQLHPPHRPRHRRHHPRAAVHGRGRGAAARPRHVLLHRAGHLSARPVRRPDRGHRHGHRGRRPAAQQHRPGLASSSDGSPVTG